MEIKSISIFSLSVIALVGIVFLLASCNNKTKKKENIETGIYLKEVFKSTNGDLNYRIFYPEGFDESKKYPVLLFMHGAGERGEDNEAQLVHGSELIAAGMNKYNAIAIFPQCPTEDYWVNFIEKERPGATREFNVDVSGGPSDALGRVIELLTEVKSRSYIDTKRIYVGGLSMGGMATFDLLWRMPKTFAAAVPICGAGSPEKAAMMKDTPIRIYHGEVDAVVPVENSKKMEVALLDVGAKVETFYYPEVNHDSWTNAFAEPDFLNWIFTKNK